MKAFFAGLTLMAVLVALSIALFPMLERSSTVESPHVHVDSET